MKTPEELGADAEQSLDTFDMATAALLKATHDLDQLQQERAERKLAAVLRLVERDNPATPGKKWTWSAACDFAQFDPEYAAYKERVAEATRKRKSAKYDVKSAQLGTELYSNLVRASVGAGL